VCVRVCVCVCVCACMRTCVNACVRVRTYVCVWVRTHKRPICARRINLDISEKRHVKNTADHRVGAGGKRNLCIRKNNISKRPTFWQRNLCEETYGEVDCALGVAVERDICIRKETCRRDLYI